VNKNDNATSGKRIRTIRDGIGLSRPEFAEIVGLPERRIRMIENGERRTTEQDLTAICGVFTWATKWIIYGGPIEKEDFILKVNDINMILPNGITTNDRDQD